MPWLPEGQWSKPEGVFSPSPIKDELPPAHETGAAPAAVRRQGKWPTQCQYWNPWGVSVMAVPYSHHSSHTTSHKLPSAQPVPELEHGAESDARTTHQAAIPKEPCPDKPGEATPPPVVQSSLSSLDEAVTGSLQTSSPSNDFKEHQALLRMLAANLNLEVEELAEESNDLFNVIPIHPGVLKIAKCMWQTPFSIPPTSKKAEKKYYVPTKGSEYLYTLPPGRVPGQVCHQ